MMALPRVPTVSAERSLWLEGQADASWPALVEDCHVDVAVVGAGIAGATTALLLARQGARVALLEAVEVAGGVTGCTTAKVSALQATIYSKIRSHHGAETAAAYADASLAGVQCVADLVEQEGMECDLKRRPAFTYAASDSELGRIEKEAEAARDAGLSVETTERIDAPFTVAGAVRLDGQLELHPVRYVRGLARAVERAGSLVAEKTRVLSVEDGSPCRVQTEHATVHADRVVLATHYPLLDRGLYFARLEAKRSYCIAARVKDPAPEGMSISAGDPTRSIRSYAGRLIIGGEGHTAGAREATAARYEALERFAREHWDVEEMTHRWSGQDPVPFDQLPMIGPYLPRSKRLFVATGFMKWGLSSGSAAAILLADLIGERDNSWASRFDPNRLSLRSAPTLARLNAKAAFELVSDRLRPAETDSVSDIPPGGARIVRDGLGKTGAYRDDDGDLHAVSLRCTHLGCLLRFNAAERSWDCPCHGSRFDPDGAVLEGPATNPLERRTLDPT